MDVQGAHPPGIRRQGHAGQPFSEQVQHLHQLHTARVVFVDPVQAAGQIAVGLVRTPQREVQHGAQAAGAAALLCRLRVGQRPPVLLQTLKVVHVEQASGGGGNPIVVRSGRPGLPAGFPAELSPSTLA